MRLLNNPLCCEGLEWYVCLAKNQSKAPGLGFLMKYWAIGNKAEETRAKGGREHIDHECIHLRGNERCLLAPCMQTHGCFVVSISVAACL